MEMSADNEICTQFRGKVKTANGEGHLNFMNLENISSECVKGFDFKNNFRAKKP